MLKRILSRSNCRYYYKSSIWRNSEKPKPAESTPKSPTDQSSSSTLHDMAGHVVPKDWEKKMLVFTKRYKSLEEIPQRVAIDTLEKAKSVMRIRIANVMMVVTLIFCAYFSYSGKQKAKAGDSILKRMLEKDDQIRAEGRKNM